MKKKRRLALFGGTFDPIHLGHTAVAAHAGRQLAAEAVVFIPARRSPHKSAFPAATDADRVSMIALAIADHPGWQVSDCELNRPAPSYTLDTIRHFKTQCGDDATIYWLIGADAVRDLPYWHAIDQLLDLCTITAMYRAGCPRPDFSPFAGLWGTEHVKRLHDQVIETPLVDISSTLVRQRLAAGQDVSDVLHPAVLEYIQRRGLYR